MSDDLPHKTLHGIAQVCRMDKPPSGPFTNWPPGRPVPPLTVDPDATGALTYVQSSFPNLSVGLIQFDDPNNPSFFGWNQDKECLLGSLGKIAILYAAFQLRDDVRTALAQPGVDWDNLDARLRKMWADSCVEGLPTTAGKAPYLDRIFKRDTDPAEFQGFDGLGIPPNFVLPPDAVIGRLDDTHELEYEMHASRLQYMQRWAQLLDLNFAEQLWLVSRWSDNAAATICAATIGMPYIFALMKNSGLYSATGAGRGLRLLKAYEDPPHWSEFSRVIEKPDGMTDAGWNNKLKGYRTFIEPFGNSDYYYQPERTRLSKVMGLPVARVGPTQGGTVSALASLMVSLVQGNLIRPNTGASTDPAQQIVSFLRLPFRDGHPTVRSAKSFIVNALQNSDTVLALTGSAASTLNYFDVWSKLGIAQPYFVDWAFLAPTPAKKIGIIILNYKSTHRASDGEVFGPLDEYSDDFNDCARAIVAAL
jgi:hypothetical protein